MRKLFTLTFLVVFSGVASAQLTVEKIMQDPAKWIGTSPSNIFWSDDSKTIYFSWNPDQNPADSLYKITLTNKNPQKVSLAERQALPAGRFGAAMSKDGSKKLFIKEGDIVLKDMISGQERQLTQTLERKGMPSFSGDETQVIYTVGNNLFALNLNSGQITQLTNFVSEMKRPETRLSSADKALEKDQQDLFMILREEKEKRDASRAYNKLTEVKKLREISTDGKQLQGTAISPDLKYVFFRLTEMPRNIKRTIVPNYVTDSGYTEDIPTRTKVGQPSATSEAFVYNIAKDTVFKINTKNIPGITEQPEYLKEYKADTTSKKSSQRAVNVYGPVWSPLGTHAVVVVRSQDNKDRWIMELDPENGQLKLIDRQRDEAWIGGPGIGGGFFGLGTVGFLDDHTLYFQSEKTGYSHLYTANLKNGQESQLTSGNFEVQSVLLSNDKKWFYMQTNEVHPGETHYYRMAVTGGDREKLTQMAGGNEVSLSPDEKTLAIRYSTTTTPWELYVQENSTSAKAEKITSSTTSEFRAYNWKAPEVISFTARDGKEVYARVYQPRKKNGKGVVFVHGAGYLQNAHKWWSQYFREYMFHNLLVDKGYTVMDIDYRASSGYGRDVRTGIYRHMGGKDLEDNVDGAKLLVQKYGVNTKKIGVYGGSYGGFITLMAMFTTPDVFAAGAALRPVTDWAAYNQGYTANILNEPQTDSIAYRRSSPIFFAEGLKGKLLICHGQVDVNVHIQDSYRLTQRLIELRKENWEMASYPVEDHGFVHPTSWMDEYKRILKIFEEM